MAHRNIRYKQTRGFYKTEHNDVWLRKGFHLIECDGEAHSNPFIDNCVTCMPLWGEICVPEWIESTKHYK